MNQLARETKFGIKLEVIVFVPSTIAGEPKSFPEPTSLHSESNSKALVKESDFCPIDLQYTWFIYILYMY